MLCFAQEKVPPEDGWPGKRLANEIAAQFARIEAAFSVSYDYRYAPWRMTYSVDQLSSPLLSSMRFSSSIPGNALRISSVISFDVLYVATPRGLS